MYGRFIQYESNERFDLNLEVGEDADGESFVFLHLDIHIWNKSVYRELLALNEELRLDLFKSGFDRMSFYIRGENNLKFHKIFGEFDYCQPFGPGQQWVVAGWFLGEQDGT